MSKKLEQEQNILKWSMFFDEREKYDPSEHPNKQFKSFRIPNDLYRQIVKDMRTIEDNIGKTNFTEFVVLSLMVMSNTFQNDKGEFVSKRNGLNLTNFIKHMDNEGENKMKEKLGLDTENK